MVEALAERIEPFNGTGFQDWKFKCEMAGNAIHTGALDLLQLSEASEKEACFSSEMEQQISSQLYFTLAKKSRVRRSIWRKMVLSRMVSKRSVVVQQVRCSYLWQEVALDPKIRQPSEDQDIAGNDGDD